MAGLGRKEKEQESVVYAGSVDSLAKDPAFMSGVITVAKKNYKAMTDRLALIAMDDPKIRYVQNVFDKNGKPHSVVVHPTYREQIMALKELNDMSLGKVLPTKKDTGPEKGKGTEAELRESILAVEKRMRQEKAKRLKELAENGDQRVIRLNEEEGKEG